MNVYCPKSRERALWNTFAPCLRLIFSESNHCSRAFVFFRNWEVRYLLQSLKFYFQRGGSDQASIFQLQILLQSLSFISRQVFCQAENLKVNLLLHSRSFISRGPQDQNYPKSKKFLVQSPSFISKGEWGFHQAEIFKVESFSSICGSGHTLFLKHHFETHADTLYGVGVCKIRGGGGAALGFARSCFLEDTTAFMHD